MRENETERDKGKARHKDRQRDIQKYVSMPGDVERGGKRENERDKWRGRCERRREIWKSEKWKRDERRDRGKEKETER